VRVLTVNAGSTGLKLHIVEDGESSRVQELVEADAVGHRVVHGGERFVEPVVVEDDVEEAIDALSTIAPLHNEPALAAIRRARRELPDVPHVAVFDTAFHTTMPYRASTYAVPARWRDEWRVRRYGFHGLSVQWVSEQVDARRLVVCHLGGGSSITAVLDGRSVDTTMGFSPLEGVPMATRSGSVDPGVLLYVQREHGLTPDELDHALQRESGLLGLGGSSDTRELAGTPALDVYTYRIATAVGSMAVALGGLDVLAFSGGVGEGSADVRHRVTSHLGFLGDFAVRVVPAREELVIAREVERLLES
jgi:acetate kinase